MKAYKIIISLAWILCSCGVGKSPEKEPVQTAATPGSNQMDSIVISPSMPTPDTLGNAIYYWKTTFKLSDWDKSFLQRHQIKRMYVRFFDVDFEQDLDGEMKPIPIATTSFKSGIPDSIELVPVVYITTQAIRGSSSFETELYERIKAMCQGNKLGTFSEIQLDCDWTTKTETSFFALCERLRRLLSVDGVKLSATIRLHQLKSQAPPVDRGVLMLYNTGSLYDPNEENSILKASDVEPYLKESTTYHLPLSFAFPAFKWTLAYRNNKFLAIVTNKNRQSLTSSDNVRIEKSSIREILKVKELLSEHLKNPASGIILYHLDKSNLQDFKEPDINAIYE